MRGQSHVSEVATRVKRLKQKSFVSTGSWRENDSPRRFAADPIKNVGFTSSFSMSEHTSSYSRRPEALAVGDSRMNVVF